MIEALVSLYFALIYVLPLYVFNTGLPRNHPKTVWTRITATTIALSALVWLPSYFTFTSKVGRHNHQDYTTSSHMLLLLGLRTSNLFSAALYPLLLTAILFLGPIVMLLLSNNPLPSYTLPIACRNFIAAPLSEEVCFRSGLISFLVLNNVSISKCIFLSPLVFGVSHLHHYRDLTTHQGYTSQQAVGAVLGQLMYTTLFGWYAAFLFLRTGHLVAIVLPHAFCNYMGFPDFGAVSHQRYARLVGIAFVLGIIGFILLLYPLTDPTLYGYTDGFDYYSSVVDTFKHLYF